MEGAVRLVYSSFPIVNRQSAIVNSSLAVEAEPEIGLDTRSLKNRALQFTLTTRHRAVKFVLPSAPSRA